MRLIHCSDLHLEFNENPKLDPNPEDILIIAGDLIPTDTLRANRTDATARSRKKALSRLFDVASGYKKTLIIGGNHECYGGDITTWVDEYNYFIHNIYEGDSSKFTVLDHGYYKPNKRTVILGCTLWTDMNKKNPVTCQAVGQYMNDFRFIRNTESRYFTTYDAADLHVASLNWLSEQYKYHTLNYETRTPEDMDVVMLTHHAPCSKSIGPRTDGETDYGYFSDLSDWILDRPQIKYWIHGHTHHPVDYMIGECRVLSNPRGYGMMLHQDECFAKFDVNAKSIDLGDAE